MRMKTAMAEMNEMAAGMVSTIGGSGDTLNRLHEMVEEERTKAAGRARMARDSMDARKETARDKDVRDHRPFRITPDRRQRNGSDLLL